MATQVDFLTQVFARVTGGLSGTAPEIFVASSDQTEAVITTAGAVANLIAQGMLKVNDIIFVNGDQDGTPFQGLYTVTDTNDGSLVAYSVSGGGSGDLLAANNLSDLASASAARGNLGIKKGTTAAYGGGGTSNAYTATGLVSTDVVTASILASANAVSICKVVPTANTLTVTFSADPGAGTTVQWHAVSV